MARQILIVEDEPLIREFLAELLAFHGFRVRTASNGQTALNALHQGADTCLILLDLMMPIMDGWTFLARQRAEPKLASIPVVLLSGVADVATEADLVSAAGYLGKPVDLDRLLEAVGRYC